MPSVMVDLYCGRGGWTKGFMAHGWTCYGIDLYPQPMYPGTFIQADITQLVELPEADFYCCSSPCEQFSVHGMKMFHKNPKWPWFGLALFESTRHLLEATGKPYIMENVRAAQKFLGYAVNHCGPFYLWGTGVPPIWPAEAYRVIKGMTKEALGFREFKGSPGWNRRHADSIIAFGSKSKERKEAVAKNAEIPEIISAHVAACFTHA